MSNVHTICRGLLESYSVQRILGFSDTFDTNILHSLEAHLRHAPSASAFLRELFNLTVLWSNADVRECEGYDGEDTDRDLVLGFDEH